MHATRDLAITRLTATIGAEIHGLDLAAEPTDTTVGLLRTALAEHHVVVLRDQFLSPAQHAALAMTFGPILPSPVQLATAGAAPGGATSIPTVTAVSTIEDTAERPPAGFPWHTDVSWTRNPPALGFLAAVTIPAFGGDTIWASTAAVFDALTPAQQARCERSTVLHAPDASLLASIERHHGPAVADRIRRDHPGTEHPLVRCHPVTGRRALFLSPLYARSIIGPADLDGPLLSDLHAMLDDPHVQLRWRWREGDVVIWDEASTCHRALTDHFPQRRVMRRCVTGAAWTSR